MEISYQISQQNKVLSISPVYSNWINFVKKVSTISWSTISMSFKVFFPEIQKFFFSVTLRSLLFSNCQLAMCPCFESKFGFKISQRKNCFPSVYPLIQFSSIRVISRKCVNNCIHIDVHSYVIMLL